MAHTIEGIYDLTENSKDVLREINSDSDNKNYPSQEDLARVRAIIQAHYAWVAKRLGQGYKVQFSDCATWQLKLRKGRQVSDFKGGRFEIPDFFEVKVNASPTMEALIQEGLTPPVPDVK